MTNIIKEARPNIDMSVKELSAMYTRLRDAQHKSTARAVSRGAIPTQATKYLEPKKLSDIKKSAKERGVTEQGLKADIINAIKSVKSMNSRTRALTPSEKKATKRLVDTINKNGGTLRFNTKNPTDTKANIDEVIEEGISRSAMQYGNGHGLDYEDLILELQDPNADMESKVPYKALWESVKMLAPNATPEEAKKIFEALYKQYFEKYMGETEV